MASDATVPPEDRRQNQRFPVALPVDWPGGSGITRDVSRGGAYFLTDRPPPSDRPLQLSLPIPDHDTGEPVLVQCRSEVLRLEASEGRWGVAVRFVALGFEKGTLG